MIHGVLWKQHTIRERDINMSKHPCRKAFDKGQEFRQRTPLTSGRYKIEEAAKRLRDMRTTLKGIAEITCARGKYPPSTYLPCCEPSNRATFLKGVPQEICSLLGREILPGIEALGGDGVSPAKVRELAILARRRIDAIIEDAGRTHDLLKGKGGIQIEYGAQIAGDSYLNCLFDDTEDLIWAALDACPQWPE